jgi:hypothetical protein
VAEIDAEVRAKFTAVKPKESCRFYVGLGMAAVARKHMIEPRPASSAALLGMAPSTRVDAQASLDLLAKSDDAELRAYLIAGLRAFLEIV